MNFDMNSMPATFDIIHAGLAAFGVLFFFLFVLKKGKAVEIEKTVEVAKIVEVETPIEKIIEVEKVIEVEKIVEKIVEVESKIKTATPESALQLLALLQSEARFIDFLREDLTGFNDSDVGAAARVIHEGGQKVLADYFTLSPIRNEDEESSITLTEEFDATEVRLTGNVVGRAPFTGTLIHKGWKVTSISLPKMVDGYDAYVIAPAEVEL
jgi:hypothetical protein